MGRVSSVLILFVCTSLLSGCGSSQAPTVPLSGTVTFDGKPVPVGLIEFIPQVETAQEAVTASAKIADGNYEIPGNPGVALRPTTVRITGYDGQAFTDEEGYESPDGRQLFPVFEDTITIGADESVRDFVIPKR